ncbi:MAG TPA: hypothetical protein V6D06_05205 [Trichocoleus sp.]
MTTLTALPETEALQVAEDSEPTYMGRTFAQWEAKGRQYPESVCRFLRVAYYQPNTNWADFDEAKGIAQRFTNSARLNDAELSLLAKVYADQYMAAGGFFRSVTVY